MTRDWDEATSAMKRVPTWYKIKILFYVGFCIGVFFGFGILFGLWLGHNG